MDKKTGDFESLGDFFAAYKSAVLEALKSVAKEFGVSEGEFGADVIALETPANEGVGDLAVPLFRFSKLFHTSPQQIATKTQEALGKSIEDFGKTSVAGGYLNLHYNKALFSKLVLTSGQQEKPLPKSERKKITIEFSAPNTNKPLHLGHLRNDALGESLARILAAAGHEVTKVNLINDRGVHICKSMLSYKLFHEKAGDTPESLGIKGDHFVGNCYVEFDKYSKEHPEALEAAQSMLSKWEAGDEEVRALWKKMNEWTLEGINATYKRTGVSFDKFYYESNTYKLGKDLIEKGLEKGVFFKGADGSIKEDVTSAVGAGRDGEKKEKVLLRGDGTSVYITQDLGTAALRHEELDFDQMIYVTASEQLDHFKMLFYTLGQLGFSWAAKLKHLSYGLVNLPNGRMKSREGTVVDADDLLDELAAAALTTIREKGYVEKASEKETSEKIALGAVHYYLLSPTPQKDITFDSQKSLSFTGNTGPYLQYMGSRLVSIQKKAAMDAITADGSDISLLNSSEEFALIKALSKEQATLLKAAEKMDPSIMANYTYELCTAFSAFYNKCPVADKNNLALSGARLLLVNKTLETLCRTLELILVPFLERM